MHLSTFRISGLGIYESVTQETDITVELWCNDHCDLLHIKGTDVADAVDPVRQVVGIQDCITHDAEAVVITDDCLLNHETGLVEDYARANNCLLLPPLRYRDGAKIVRVLALDSTSLSHCYRDMVADGLTVSVDSKREVDTVTEQTPVITARDTLPQLTDRQRTILLKAIEAGYYEIPRRCTTGELAETVGLARRTAEDHLRRAEKKVVTGMAEFLRQ